MCCLGVFLQVRMCWYVRVYVCGTVLGVACVHKFGIPLYGWSKETISTSSYLIFYVDSHSEN